jgi:acetylornithine deacetylase/succinyl-diaminopimelate desuccinylase-like protein
VVTEDVTRGRRAAGTDDGLGDAAAALTAELVSIDSVNPSLVSGAAGGGLHAADEWVDLAQVRRYAVALVDAVTRWAADRAD